MGSSDRSERLVAQIAAAARARRLTVGAAESLTGGNLSAALSAGPNAAEWYRGTVVAYAADVKFAVLDVAPGPVNTASCAAAMASNVRSLLGCDIAVATTGVGGPGPAEGVPAGTVFIAVASDGLQEVDQHDLDGEPSTVLHRTVELGLRAVLRALEDGNPGSQE